MHKKKKKKVRKDKKSNINEEWQNKTQVKQILQDIQDVIKKKKILNTHTIFFINVTTFFVVLTSNCICGKK